MDRAGWHSTDKLTIPKNLTIILLRSKSPELSPVKNICNISDRTGSRILYSTITALFLMPDATLGET
jgi:hypothetical protein